MFVVVRSYTHVHEAHLAKSVLEASGIEAFIANEHLVSMAWTYSNAVGGVTVAVPEERADEAGQILGSVAFPMDGPLAAGPQSLPDASETCRRCGAAVLHVTPTGAPIRDPELADGRRSDRLRDPSTVLRAVWRA